MYGVNSSRFIVDVNNIIATVDTKGWVSPCLCLAELYLGNNA